MNKVILVRYGEIGLKGLNRNTFEDKLIKNMKNGLKELGGVKISKSQSRIYIETQDEDFDLDEAVKRLKKVFGIVSVSIAQKVSTDFEEIKEEALKLAKKLSYEKGLYTFKVEAKRGNKKFPISSPEICKELGAYILSNIPALKVSVNEPSFVLYVEVREESYIYYEKVSGLCGMPTGTNGKALLLLSGGIDSPVAGWMVAKRGVELDAVHFYSYPYTSERAKDKVIELAKILAQYTGNINLHVVPFTDIQLLINEKCHQELLTIIMRRIMMTISERIADAVNAQALITGESIGQVASQTMQSLVVTNGVVNMPIFRPLIGMDKNEVVDIAKKIGTFETSILPYEDCCTVFVSKHPNTKPRVNVVLKEEDKLIGIEDMVNKAILNTEIIKINTNYNCWRAHKF